MDQQAARQFGEKADHGNPSEWKCVQVMGVAVLSDYPFSTNLPSCQSPARLRFTRGETVSIDELSPPVYTSPALNRNGRPFAFLHRVGDDWLLRITDAADYLIGPDSVLFTQRCSDLALVETFFLSSVLSFWLELRNVVVLHGSAVEVDGAALGFLAWSQVGKSTLAGQFVACGCPLVSDDLLALERRADRIVVHPGPPQMKMWPEASQHLFGFSEELERVHPEYEKRRVPLATGDSQGIDAKLPSLSGLFVLDRGEAAEPLTLRAFSKAEAVVEMVRHSFVSRLAAAAGLQPKRLHRLAQIARRVPVFDLSYPSGLELLPEVRRAVLNAVRTAL